MPEHEILPARMMDAISGALKPVLGEEGFDTGIDGHTRAMDVSSDDWTVHIEWARGVAWLAIDDEPNDPGKHDQARRAVMSEAVEEAWREINDELDGFLVDALTHSGDPFSISFAAALSNRDDHAPGNAIA